MLEDTQATDFVVGLYSILNNCNSKANLPFKKPSNYSIVELKLCVPVFVVFSGLILSFA